MEFYTFQQYQESAAALAERLGDFKPEILLILGSGLGDLGDEVERPVVVPYTEVPHMKRSTVPADTPAMRAMSTMRTAPPATAPPPDAGTPPLCRISSAMSTLVFTRCKYNGYSAPVQPCVRTHNIRTAHQSTQKQ